MSFEIVHSTARFGRNTRNENYDCRTRKRYRGGLSPNATCPSKSQTHWGWAFPERAATCLLLFGSGFIRCLAACLPDNPGFGLMRSETRSHRHGLRPLPLEARSHFTRPTIIQFCCKPPSWLGSLAICGRKDFDYGQANDKLTALMNGAANCVTARKPLACAISFGARTNDDYQSSSRPWEATAFLVASGDWGAIYDLAKAAPQQ